MLESRDLAKLIKHTFDPIYEAPISVWERFAEFCELASFKKNEIIKAEGARERNGYFILEGSGGVFVWKDSTYVCLDLMFENDFFGDTMSLYTGDPSPIETRALENSKMLKISSDNIRQLKETEMGKLLFSLAAEDDFVKKQRQQIDLLLKTAEQRYVEMLERQPGLILRTPQKHVASLLGITTQSLSRIRKKLE